MVLTSRIRRAICIETAMRSRTDTFVLADLIVPVTKAVNDVYAAFYMFSLPVVAMND